MKYLFITSIFLVNLVTATPPACFLSCINELARGCDRDQSDVGCLCGQKDTMVGCLVDICPYGTFESARDHYLGTCLEQGVPGEIPPPYTRSSPSSPTPTKPVAVKPKPKPKKKKAAKSKPKPKPKPAPEPVKEPEPVEEPVEEPVPVDEPVAEPEPVPEPVPVDEPIAEPEPVPEPVPEPAPIATKPAKKPHPAPTVVPMPDSESDSDCDSDSDSGSDSDSDSDEDVPCEWEEEETVDKSGALIIIRRPINVPKKFRRVPGSDAIRRKVIIKSPRTKAKKPKQKYSDL